MKNNQNGAGRKVVVSDFEMCPIDPLEFSFQQMPKCYGQMSVDTEAKTITFKRTGGSAPGMTWVFLMIWFAIIDLIEICKGGFITRLYYNIRIIQEALKLS